MSERRAWVHSFQWAFKTALRDGRGARGKAVLYALSMALGIGALVAMGSLEADMAAAVKSQTQSLVGADLVIWGREPFNPATQAFLDKIPGERADYKDFASMARFPKVDASHLARIRALQGHYPFYGILETEPAAAAQTFDDGPNALVALTLMERTGAQVGDTVWLGEAAFTIAGILERTPGETMAAASLGPRIYIPQRYLDQTGLVRRGSRVFYSNAFKLPPELDPDTFVSQNETFLNQQRLTWDTVKKRRESLGESLGNLADYLNLTACLALLLGGLGVAGAVFYHLKRKTRQIATLRCLGATHRQVTAVFLIQVSLMTLLAIVLGSAIGIGVQYLLPLMIEGLLPIKFTPQLHPLAVLVACGWGWLMSMLLAAMPLLRVRHISPLSCFRPDLVSQPKKRERLLVPTLVGLAWFLFACLRTGSWLKGSLFTAALLVSFALLLLVARLLSLGARKLKTRGWPFPLRHGLANLFRPQNQTSAFLVILGMGVFLITVLTGMRSMLLASFEGALDQGRPNFIAFDIQADQVDELSRRVREIGLPVRDLVPIVPMRLSKLKGQPIAELASSLPDWAAQREYRSTYRENLVATEKLVEGQWQAQAAAEAEVIPVSMETDIAKTLGLKLGDNLTMDVLGIEMELVIASLRKVDWQSMQPNFFIVFPMGVLEQAPQMYVLTTRTADEQQSGELQKALVDQWPNISCMDMTEVVRTIDDIIGKAAAAIRFLAGLCIAIGFLLLGSAIWNSRGERLGEWALLRTLGASRRQMAATTLVEYFLLGIFAAVTGLGLAIAANWALGRFLFEVPPFPHPAQLLSALLVLPLLTLLLGYLGLRSIWNQAPRYILKQEE